MYHPIVLLGEAVILTAEAWGNEKDKEKMSRCMYENSGAE